ncbi:Nn.00g078990.m01.CDS01 [Neocucurbitaria sp. VM-36]
MAAVASARYSNPHDTQVATSSTNLDKTTIGRDSALRETVLHKASAADMNYHLNAQALPFRPGGYDNDRREQNYNGFENQLPAPPPFPPPFPPGPASAPWNPNYPPPPPPPFYNNNNQQAYNDYAAQAQAQAYYHQWGPHPGFPGPQPGFQAYGQQPFRPQQPYYGAPPTFGQQNQRNYSNQAYHHSAMQSQPRFPHDAMNEYSQYGFDALIRDLKSKSRRTNNHNRASAPPNRMLKSGVAGDGQTKQKEYGPLHRVALHDVSSRINKLHSTAKAPKASTPASKKGRYGDEKIMLPAPQPTPEYLSQAAEEPSTIEPPGHVLVILDLNGTVLYRPNRNAKTMIERPFLRPFLRYLFQNFSVMVWSSAKPDNVKSLVMQSLDKDLQSRLVARWARDSFGLSPTNYNQNVQVYKNLKLVWSRDVIQQHHPEYAAGKRFGQHNTVLIDDTVIKASAQPHNLLEIPEFSATPEQMEGDVLREVAGYLEALRQQTDVSKYIRADPFKEGGQWSFDWPEEAAGGGEMKVKVSTKGKRQKTKAAGANGTKPDISAEPLSETIDSMSSVQLAASVQKDW